MREVIRKRNNEEKRNGIPKRREGEENGEEGREEGDWVMPVK